MVRITRAHTNSSSSDQSRKAESGTTGKCWKCLLYWHCKNILSINQRVFCCFWWRSATASMGRLQGESRIVVGTDWITTFFWNKETRLGSRDQYQCPLKLLALWGILRRQWPFTMHSVSNIVSLILHSPSKWTASSEWSCDKEEWLEVLELLR